MAAILTTVGSTHIDQLNDGAGTTHPFDGLLLGAGNDTPAVGDTQAQLTVKLASTPVQVSTGYPRLSDPDARNSGRGDDKWSWAFVVPEGTGFATSNLAVTNYNGGAAVETDPLCVHSDSPVSKCETDILTVFVNVDAVTKAVVIVAVKEKGPNAPTQLQGWRRQMLLMSGSSSAHPQEGPALSSLASEGDLVRTSGYFDNDDGGALGRADVLWCGLNVYRRRGQNDWVLRESHALDVFEVMPSSPVKSAAFWRGSVGYNFTHAWRPDPTFGSRRARLEYYLRLTSGGELRFLHHVEFRGALG